MKYNLVVILILKAFNKKVQQNLRRTKLLEHDFIAFPLNVTNEHWIMLIVCFPG